MLLALITALGWHVYRWRGAMLALLIGSLPGAIIAAALTEVQTALVASPWGKAFFVGAGASVCGLIASSIYKIVEPYFDAPRWLSSALVLAACCALGFAGLSPLLLFLLAGLAGALLVRNPA